MAIIKNIKSKTVLAIDIHGYNKISFMVYSFEGILSLTHIDKIGSQYFIRQKVLEMLTSLLHEYHIDILIFEKNYLFIDKIDRHPDPLIMRNILLGFGLAITIDNYAHTLIDYILELPEYEWKKEVLNSSVKYSIDLYKAHILNQEYLTEDQIKLIEDNNYYKLLCLSESIQFDSLMNTKYQINKE